MVFWGNDYLWMAWATVLMGLFSSAPMPIFEAVTLSYLQQDTHRYSRIRIWGSIGFVAAVFATGWAINAGLLLLECVPTVVFLAFSSMVLVALCLPSRSVRRADLDQGSLKTIIKRPGVVAFFLAFFLIQMAHGPYYTFFSVFLKERGYDASQTGWLWSLGILAEIFLFWHFHKLFPRFSVRAMLLAAIALSVLRWLLIGWWVENLIALSIAQILHAASFGATHVSAMQFIHRHFGAGHQGKGQALYSSLSFGLGGMVGSYLSGEVWASFGPEFVFSAAAGVTLLAWIIAWGWVDRPVRAENGRVST
jgi:PPP family 3-phenylpropionic acid transporter